MSLHLVRQLASVPFSISCLVHLEDHRVVVVHLPVYRDLLPHPTSPVSSRSHIPVTKATCQTLSDALRLQCLLTARNINILTINDSDPETQILLKSRIKS